MGWLLHAVSALLKFGRAGTWIVHDSGQFIVCKTQSPPIALWVTVFYRVQLSVCCPWRPSSDSFAPIGFIGSEYHRQPLYYRLFFVCAEQSPGLTVAFPSQWRPAFVSCLLLSESWHLRHHVRRMVHRFVLGRKWRA